MFELPSAPSNSHIISERSCCSQLLLTYVCCCHLATASSTELFQHQLICCCVTSLEFRINGSRSSSWAITSTCQSHAQAPPHRRPRLLLTAIGLSHTRTVVRECFKGDEASQWKRPKIDPSPHQNPLTDLHKNWQA